MFGVHTVLKMALNQSVKCLLQVSNKALGNEVENKGTSHFPILLL